MTTYDRPVEATLHVHLANGETWEATPEDLMRFGLTSKLDAYARVRDLLATALPWRADLTGSPLNAVRHLAETAIVYPDLIDIGSPQHAEMLRDVGLLDRLLEQHTSEIDDVGASRCGLPSEDDPTLTCVLPIRHGAVDLTEDGFLHDQVETPGEVSTSHGTHGAAWTY